MKYIHGGDIYGKQIDLDFSVNVNPLGMPKGGVEAAMEGIGYASQYPDYNCTELKGKIAEKKKIDRENILVGNGAAELIFAFCQSIHPCTALAVAPCFGEYERAVQSVGGHMKYVPLSKKADFEIQEDFVSMITDEIDIVFICNPNNPTGKLIPKEIMRSIIRKCKETNTYLCVDECFLPFLPNEEEYTLLGSKYPHVIILRAFTKIYGMPGLRLGYAACEDKELLYKTRMVLQPWNVSIPAQMAGIAALEDESYLKETHRLIQKERNYLKEEMEKGLAEKVYDSKGNFLLFKAQEDLAEQLLKKKILIRDCSNFPNLSRGYFRICVSGHKENMELVKRWKEMSEQ
ncbi:MAG: aminotransferase class I/II-fold pyridoxal phosphate-dependent enzyme [Lachnospiraceae bacterium]|nr:aminotransferase class I/II-fold pyridoxal phosphate-dependent enzyme [Lachnospiraceae bacterium]